MSNWEFSNTGIWDVIKRHREEFGDKLSLDNSFVELCRDYEEVLEKLRFSEEQSQENDRHKVQDLELVRLLRDLERDILARIADQQSNRARR